MFKHKRRSFHGIYSSTQSVPISRSANAADTVKVSSMGSTDAQARAYYVDSVMAGSSPDSDAKVDRDVDGPVNEPLVVDFAAMHDEHSINGSNAPLVSPSTRANGSWISDDDTAAAAPPDFSGRRDISHHIPLRTR